MQDDLSVERDFSRTYREFVHEFPSDDACADLEQDMVTGPVTEADVTFGYDWSQKQGRRS